LIIIFFIIVENSPKSISPFPSPSTSLTIFSHTFLSILYSEQSIFLISSALIDPLPSLSNKLKAYSNYSVANNFYLSIVATTHSE